MPRRPCMRNYATGAAAERSDRLLDHPDRAIEFFFADDERRLDPDHVAVRPPDPDEHPALTAVALHGSRLG